MTSWKSEQQFVEDRCLLSEFYYAHKYEPEKQFVYKSKEPEKKTLQSLYFDSDSEEEMTDCEIDSRSQLQRFDDISTQIKNAVGHRYRNDVIEKYFKTRQNESELENKKSNTNSDTVTSSTVTCSAVNNTISVTETNTTEPPATANTETKTKPAGSGRRRKGRNKTLSKSGSSLASSCPTPSKYSRYGESGDAGVKSSKAFKDRNGFNHATNDCGKYFNQPAVQTININSNKEFPRL